MWDSPENHAKIAEQMELFLEMEWTTPKVDGNYLKDSTFTVQTGHPTGHVNALNTHWLRGTVVERRSLAGKLSLSCAPPVVDG